MVTLSPNKQNISISQKWDVPLKISQIPEKIYFAVNGTSYEKVAIFMLGKFEFYWFFSRANDFRKEYQQKWYKMIH